jgi:two-component system nitrogen regulation sensor histidine kinase NtrY
MLHLIVHWPRESKIIIYADKEQLNGVFSNLIKNGIQSVPTGQAGAHNFESGCKGNDKVVVSVTDNGTGIPESFKEESFHSQFYNEVVGNGTGVIDSKEIY